MNQGIKRSIVCACMNRSRALELSVQSWVVYDSVHEVIVVDWSSDVPVTISRHKSRDKVNIIRVENQKQFSLSKAYNLAIKHTTGDEILKLDVDYMLNPYNDYFAQNKLTPGMFITGDHKIGTLRDEHGFIRPLNGLIHIYKRDFNKVGGYNEDFQGYGYDDEDLYNRLTDINLNRKYLNNNPCCVFHIPHSSQLSTDNYENKNITQTSRRNYYKSNPTVKHKIDKKICITLKQHKHLYHTHDKFDRGIEWFEAVDSRQDRCSEQKHGLKLAPVSLQQQLYFSESPGAVGCFLSHYTIWKQIVEHQTPVTMVIEEDADANDVNAVIAHYDYLVKMYQLQEADLVQHNRRLDKLNFPGDFNGTECYTVTLDGAKKLLASVHERPWFNNNVYNKPGKRCAWFEMYLNEPPQQWNQHKDCIVAAADVFIGLCGRLPDWCEHKLKIKHVPEVRLTGAPSTITPVETPFWDILDEEQVNELLVADNFKWWERDQP